MPEISVDATVEKMLKGAPSADKAVKEEPSAEAPVSDTPADGEKPETAPKDDGATELTAFEQELIEELGEEDKASFESLSPEQKKQTLNWAKRIYRKNAKQMTELGTLRKAIGTLRDSGVTNEDLVELVRNKRSGSSKADSPQNENNGEKKGFDRWLSKADKADEREELQNARQVIREEIEQALSEFAGKEVKPIKERLEWTDRQAIQDRLAGLDEEINSLEDGGEYPGSLIETYREDIKRLAVRYPKKSAEELLVDVAGYLTVKKAVQSRKDRSESSNGKGNKPPASVVRKPVQMELPRKKNGSISVMDALDKVFSKKK